jgi:hypothetical protein
VAGTETALVYLSLLAMEADHMQSLRAPRFDTAQRCPGVGYALSSLTDNIFWSDGGQRLKQAPIRIPQYYPAGNLKAQSLRQGIQHITQNPTP